MSSPSKDVVVKATFPAEVLPESSIAKFIDCGLVEAWAGADLDHEGEAVQVLEGLLADLVCWLIITDLIIITTTTTPSSSSPGEVLKGHFAHLSGRQLWPEEPLEVEGQLDDEGKRAK